MKNFKITLMALSTLSVSFTTFIACEKDTDDQDGIDGSDEIISLTSSKTPNFLKATDEFANLEITPILSSEDTIPNSPDFVYGSMADGSGL